MSLWEQIISTIRMMKLVSTHAVESFLTVGTWAGVGWKGLMAWVHGALEASSREQDRFRGFGKTFRG